MAKRRFSEGSVIIEETEQYVVEKDVPGAVVKMHKARKDYGGQHYMSFPVLRRTYQETIE